MFYGKEADLEMMVTAAFAGWNWSTLMVYGITKRRVDQLRPLNHLSGPLGFRSEPSQTSKHMNAPRLAWPKICIKQSNLVIYI